MNIQLTVVKGAMHALAQGAASGALANLGIPPQDMQTIQGNIPWNGSQRTLVVRTLETLMFSSLDIMGIPRFSVPAEYVAAAITMFVHPSNILVASVWMESGRQSADALGNPVSASINREEVDAQQIFSLVLQLAGSSEVARCQQQFESRMKVSILHEMSSLTGANQNEIKPQNTKQKRS